MPEKGAAALSDAFRSVQTDKRLVIAGGSSDSDQFVEKLYRNTYLYVLPSDAEGMPLTLLEALSYDCCCVTSDIAECVSVLGGHSVTFPQGNTVTLRETLQTLCNNGAVVKDCQRGKGGLRVCLRGISMGHCRGPDPGDLQSEHEKMIRVLQCVNNMHRAGLETILMNYYRCMDRTRLQFDFLTHRPEKSDYDDEIEVPPVK